MAIDRCQGRVTVICLPSQVRELGIRRGPLEESALISVLRLHPLSHCTDSLAQELIDEIITHVPRKASANRGKSGN